MSRTRLVLAAALLCAVPLASLHAGETSVASLPGVDTESGVPEAKPAPAPPKLVFTYPCTFAYSDGRPYETRVMDWECDYIHASVKGGSEYFNKTLPTLDAQTAFLDVTIRQADDYHNAYMLKVADLIKKTDPASLPKTLSETARIDKTAALNIELSQGIFEAAQPFLWPPREQDSYVSKTAGMWPPSWTPYIQPIYDRSGQLSGMVADSEMKLIDKASADLDKKVRAAELKKTLSRVKTTPAAAGPALSSLFDGAGTVEVVAPDPPNGGAKAHLADAAGAPRAAGASRAASDLLTAPPPSIDGLDMPPPPQSPTIPTSAEAREKRNYFARGVSAGLARLKDDETVGLWHALGLTSTVGNPSGKASLAFQQNGPSCAVSSIDEALRARGKNIPMNQLAKEGLDKGYYVDYETNAGARDGGETDWRTLNYLLRDHDVPYEYLTNATPQQLDAAIRNSPNHDAIVDVEVKAFWNDSGVPDGAQHALYVTGEEVEPSGKVRGYYVNDTGTGEAARFVSADKFNKVWINAMVAFPK